MYRLLALLAVAGSLCVGLSFAGGEGPAPKEREPKNYTVSCKLTRKLEVIDENRKSKLITSVNKMPDVTALEGTRGQYRSGEKLNGEPCGFQLRAEVRPASGDKVRLAVMAELCEVGSGSNPPVQSYSQEVIRHVRLGQAITLELHLGDNGGGIWLELTVREAAE